MNQAPTTSPLSLPCPRCKKPLIDPKGLGWCKACGYCHSLADGDVATEAPTAKPNTITATGSAIGQTPTWFWVMLFGIALIAGATWAGGRFFPLSPLERALLTTGQIIASVALMFVGQFVALLKIAPEDSSLTFKDAVFPFRLYGLVFKRLPATKLTVYFCAWGITAILSAAICIGGLGHWFTYLPSSQKKQTNQIPKVQM